MQAPMQSSSPRPPPVYPSFGERRSISHDLARFSLDLGPARPGASRPAQTVPYPSPPMSHSPPPIHPLSPKQDARQRPSNSVTVPYDTQGMPGQSQEQLPYSHEQQQQQQQQQRLQDSISATTSSSAESEKFPVPFPSTNNGDNSHTHLTQISTASPGNQRSPFAAQPSFLPPQLPRRTKSHVASACVNCKKAHLACDVRRPCPRCVSLGKQDSCRDVQHKKRGRPRLRDERTHSFEVGQIGSIQSHRTENVVSPLSSPTAIPVAYRTGTHRVLKSQSNEPSRFPRRPSLTPREETLGGQSGGYFDDRPSPVAPRFDLPSPVPNATAYLTTDLVVAKSTESVRELLGYSAAELNGVRSLFDIVLSSDRDKLYRLSRRIQEEMSEREPNHLPPLSSSSVYAAIQNVTQGDIQSAIQGSRDLQETLHLRRPDGHYLRTRIQINLARTSVFFVVVVFSLVTGIPPPLQFNNSQASYSNQERIYTPTQAIPPLTSPSFMNTSQRLQGEPSGPQSPYSLHPHIALRSPVDSRPRTMQSDFPSLAQYANASAPSPGFPPARRPASPVVSTGLAYESSEPPRDLQLPPLQLKRTDSNGNDWDRNLLGATGERRPSDSSSTPRRERIDVHEMLE